ncbi:HAD hydrolase-like protein [Enterococcus cecorum]|uniref:HAD hydrolase-like protein n=1 Tax=Enterococcus cecorum TaxID=44008 RepID=UPI0030C69436
MNGKTSIFSYRSYFWVSPSIQYAMQQLNQPPLDEKTLVTFVGPPLLDSFIRIGLPKNLANEAVFKYREYYKEHMHFVELYPQMKEVLAQLKDSYQLPVVLVNQNLPKE